MKFTLLEDKEFKIRIDNKTVKLTSEKAIIFKRLFFNYRLLFYFILFYFFFFI